MTLLCFGLGGLLATSVLWNWYLLRDNRALAESKAEMAAELIVHQGLIGSTRWVGVAAGTAPGPLTIVGKDVN